MFIEYEDEAVKVLFDDLTDVQNSKNLMQRKIGHDMARSIKKRFDNLKSFSNFESLLQSRIGKIESMSGSFFAGTYSLHVSENYRLIVAPQTDDLSSKELRKCDTLIIKGVVDYHGKGAKNNWLIP